MAYESRILADSISPDGVRLVTQQVTFPRFILAETNTHRVFSRNSASSRAIPVEKNIERMLADPFVPAAFGANQKGMQAGEALDEENNWTARTIWVAAAGVAARAARALAEIGVHKQWANRLIEPFAWHTAIITATEWENWDNLRDNKDASPEIQEIARMMKASRAGSIPRKLGVGEWHLPLVGQWRDGDAHSIGTWVHDDGSVTVSEDHRLPLEQQVKLSVARCARVSYLTHDGRRDVGADLMLYDRLVSSGHMSPLEHAAKVASAEEIDRYALFKRRLSEPGTVSGFVFIPVCIGNLAVPWLQHRKMIPGEAVFKGVR